MPPDNVDSIPDKKHECILEDTMFQGLLKYISLNEAPKNKKEQCNDVICKSRHQQRRLIINWKIFKENIVATLFDNDIQMQ